MSRFTVVTQANSHSLHLVGPCETCKARDFSACAPLNPEEQKRLIGITTTLEIEANRTIFEEGNPADYVYTVTDGSVKIYKLLPDGRCQITGFLFAGDFLGLVHNRYYAYSAETLTATKLCRFPRVRLEALLDEVPRLEQQLLSMASHELAAAQDQMMLLGRKSARERLVSFLLMLANAAVRREQRGNPVSLPMNRTDIGDYLGLTIETVSRTFTKLKTSGLIELLDDKHIHLKNLPDLREIARGF